MYLSRVELEPMRRSTMSALAAPQKLHGAVESAFSGERRRRLWRIDCVNGKLWLLILSEDVPDLTGIAAQFGPDGRSLTESKDYTLLLNRIETGGIWRFRLTANPTKSCLTNTSRDQRGEVRAHCTVDYQKQWLLDRAGKHGFLLEPQGFTVTQSQWYRFYKRGQRQPVSLLSVTYEGFLRVTDPDLFRVVLTEGLGRGKAYGLGLLTVMRGGKNHG